MPSKSMPSWGWSSPQSCWSDSTRSTLLAPWNQKCSMGAATRGPRSITADPAFTAVAAAFNPQTLHIYSSCQTYTLGGGGSSRVSDEAADGDRVVKLHPNEHDSPASGWVCRADRLNSIVQHAVLNQSLKTALWLQETVFPLKKACRPAHTSVISCGF